MADNEQLTAILAKMTELLQNQATFERGSTMGSTKKTVPKFGEKREDFEKFLRKLKSVMAARSRKSLEILEAVLAAEEKPEAEEGDDMSFSVKLELKGKDAHQPSLQEKERTSSIIYDLILEGCGHDDNMARHIETEWRVSPGHGLLAIWHLQRHFLKKDQALALELEEALLQNKQGNKTLSTYLLDTQELLHRCEVASGETMKDSTRVKHVLRGLDRRYRDKK